MPISRAALSLPLSATSLYGAKFFLICPVLSTRFEITIINGRFHPPPPRLFPVSQSCGGSIVCFSIMMASNVSPQPTCQNCRTSTTPLWRRDEYGAVLCNACGLFLKLHGRPRPISLKTDVIKSRNRVKTMRTDLAPKKKVWFAHALFVR